MLTVSELIRVLRFEQSLRDYDARRALGRPLWETPSDGGAAEPSLGSRHGERVRAEEEEKK